MNLEEARNKYRELNEKCSAYNYAMGVVYYDAETVAPAKSATVRGNSLGILSGECYEIATGDEMTSAAEVMHENDAELTEIERRSVHEFFKSREYMKSIPKDEYVAYSMLLNDAQGIWQKAKLTSDFKLFEPCLEKIFDTQRKFAKYYRPDAPAYDTLLDRYEAGLTSDVCDSFFSKVRETVVPLLAEVMKKPQPDDSFIYRHYPIEKQRILTTEVMKLMNVDMERCSVGEVEHPFTSPLNRDDVRVTTHYYEDNLTSSLYSVIHESGHALYELYSGEELTGTNLSGGVSMGIHESQSRFYENIIGRGHAFVGKMFPLIKNLFPEQLFDIDEEKFFHAVNKTQPSLIRTDADELTYSLHIMLRYEIEKAVINGEMKVSDIPAVWAEKTTRYLGISVPDDKNGCLQDSHWSGGSIGYFPSYALGSAYGAQLLAVMNREFDVEKTVKEQGLAPVVAWLEKKIYCFGCMYDPSDLLERACGDKFNPSYYTDYLKNKMTAVYGL